MMTFPSPKSASLLLLAALCFVPTHAVFGARKVGLYRFSTLQERLRVQKRDGPSCSTGSQLCPSSLNGGCCPNDRSCGLTDCPLATPLSCPHPSETWCSIQFGGCCTSGYTCTSGSCIPPYSVLLTSNICTQQGMTLCPSEFSTQCCGTNYDCGPATCYLKSVTSFDIPVTTIGTSDGTTFTQVVTVKTALVPDTARATSAPTVTKATAAPPTGTVTVKVQPATPTPTPSSGLSKKAIIGLAAGILICMIAVFAATCMTVRKLKRGPRPKKPHPDTRFKGSPHNSYPGNLASQIQIPSLSHSHNSSGIFPQYQQPTGYQIVPDTHTESPEPSDRGRSFSHGRGDSIYHPAFRRTPTDSPAPPPQPPRRSNSNTHELEAVPLPRTSISSGGSDVGVARTEPQNPPGYGRQRHQQHPYQQHLSNVAESNPTVPEIGNGRRYLHRQSSCQDTSI